MKLKHVFATLGLASVMALGVGVALAHGHKQVSEIKEANAAGETYYLTGETTAEDPAYSCLYGHTKWSTAQADAAAEIVEGEEAQLLAFDAGDKFKFVLPDTWDDSLGGADLLGSARGFFKKESNESSNILCDFGGSYKVSIKGTKVYIDLPSEKNAEVFVQLNGWEHTYVYAFDEDSHVGHKLEPLGAWPGTEVSRFTQGVNYGYGYGTEGGIGRMTVPYKNLGNTKVIFHNNAGTQTKDLGLSNKYYYWADNEKTYGDDTKGACAEVVFDIAELVNGATDGSSCNIAKQDAIDLLAKHESYIGYTLVEEATIYTWKDASKTEKEDVKFQAIIERLNIIANTPDPDPSHGFISAIQNNNGVLIVIVISSIAVISAAGLFFVIRRKKFER